MQTPLFSSALQNRLTAGLFHCNHTYGGLLFIQGCSEPAQLHCSTGLGRMHSPLFSSALQNRQTAGLFHCNHPYGGLLLIQGRVSQLNYTAALVWAECKPHCSVVLCKTGLQLACFTAITPMEVCSSFRGAVSQLNYTAALVWAECIPHCSVVLCKTGKQLACFTAITPTEVCS